jgi:outer membrane phospholipase A
MENFYESYKAYIYSIGFIVLGIGNLFYMEYDKKTRTKEDIESEYKYSIAKSTRFRIKYFWGYGSIILGIIGILKELLS